MYLSNSLNEVTTIETIDNFSFLKSTITIHGKRILITAIYGCFALHKRNFINPLINYMLNNDHFENHIISGDFNIHILNNDPICNLFLNNFHAKGFKPNINNITR